MTATRSESHARLSAHLGDLSDRDLVDQLQCADAVAGIGVTRVVDIAGARVFAKSLPLTDEEYERPYDTGNHFELPAFYHYGVGSAGFGAFRELAAHRKTTRWVLDGDITTFPLLYHHRVLPLGGETLAMTGDELERYVQYWNGSAPIRRYMLARRSARHHLVLFLEFVPHVLNTWLTTNLNRAGAIASEMKRTLALLRGRGVGHFDAHLGNILSDGHGPYLSDFGLVIDSDFDLDSDEQEFFRTHRYYDAGEFAYALYWPVSPRARAWSEETTRAVSDRYGDTELDTLLDHLDDLADGGILPLPADYRDLLRRYRDVMDIMRRVFRALRTGSKLDSTYDDGELERALVRAQLV